MTTISVGTCVLGNVSDLGGTQYGATAGLIDYSKVTFNDFGVASRTQRGFANKAEYKIKVADTDLNGVYNTLAGLRATLALWLGTTYSNFEPLNVYGFYRDFSIDIAYPNDGNFCTLSVEGQA